MEDLLLLAGETSRDLQGKGLVLRRVGALPSGHRHPERGPERSGGVPEEEMSFYPITVTSYTVYIYIYTRRNTFSHRCRLRHETSAQVETTAALL